MVDGRLRRSWRSGRAPVLAYADDHAALARSLTHLYEATGDPHWLARAVHWADTLIELFWDETEGGLFYTGHDAEALLVRSKSPMSGSEPGAQAMAALAFTRLAHFVGRADLGARADDIITRYQTLLKRHPLGFGLEAVAAAWQTAPVGELALFGEADDALARQMRDTFHHRHLPLVLLAPVAAHHEAAARALIPWLAERGPRSGQPRAYLCEGARCRLPARTPATLARYLDEPVAGRSPPEG